MLNKIKQSCINFPGNNAFFINGKNYTYAQLAKTISRIRSFLETEVVSPINIGIITNDDLETYASVLGVLYAGLTFVPINPENPLERNISIIELAGINIVLTSKNTKEIELASKGKVRFVDTAGLPDSEINLDPTQIGDSEIAYILFTSGSTGVPKGVPLTRKNLFSFISAFFALGYKLDENDRVLQMFDMTFDLSIMSYMAPLCVGACVYTVPAGGIKYTYVYGLLEDHKITFALMVPSIISYLRSYFEEIKLPDMKYSLFCGEALYEDIVSEWMECLPNALVQNVYGPTEATIFCLTYDLKREKSLNKSFNGIVCIGKPMENVEAIIVDENNNILSQGKKGELCLSGNQLTPGYLNNPQKNKESFFTLGSGENAKIYYRTGDLAYVDEDGDFMYCGRIDFQVKIQGFRVELSEIEHYAREYTGLTNVAALAQNNSIGNVQIHLYLEKFDGEIKILEDYLKKKLPQYMIPSFYTNLDNFPLNVNGKIDRKALSAANQA